VRAPEDSIPALSAFLLIIEDANLCSNLTRREKSIREMLDLAAKMSAQARVQIMSISDADKAAVDMAKGKAQLRYVLGK
jgi:D-arabinose 1-dehydrogenase-like Zn-dependent alcohol dehydrogenase